MLLVRNDKRKLFEDNLILNNRMGSQHQIGAAVCQRRIGFPFGRGCLRAGQQYGPKGKMVFFGKLFYILVVLPCKHLRRRHHGALITVGHAQK